MPCIGDSESTALLPHRDSRPASIELLFDALIHWLSRLARDELSFLHSPAASQSRRIQSSDGFPGITGVRTARHFEAHGTQPGLDGCRIRGLTALHPPKYRKNHNSRGI